MKSTRSGKRLRRLARSLAALAFVFALLAPECVMPVRAVSQADIDKLQSSASSLTKQKKALEAKLADLKDDKTDAVQKKELLDQKIDNLVAQISNAEDQISDYESLISQTEAQLADAEAKEEAQHELFCQRVRAMEERGTISYWAVLFKASSFTDLLSGLDFINEIMASDQKVIDELQTLQEQITAQKTDLETQKAGAESAKASLVSRKSELNSQRAEASALVYQIEQNESDYKSTLQAIDDEEEAIQARIVKLSKELAAQQAAEGKTSTAALGGYIWPVSSHKINSPFGPRNTGISGASTNHKGVDIGGVGYSSEVHAAKAGTVIIATRSSSYGNYVVISHGSGNTTLYGHMSSLRVSAGTYVKQGTVIGITGSTGISSGPHLHFEITENGVRVNPLKYLTNYIKCW